QEEKMNTAAGMKKFLEAHNDITLPNGMNAEKIKESEGFFNNASMQQLNPTVPAYLKNEDDIKQMQYGLGVSQTGKWDGVTETAYVKRMNDISGRVYQEDAEISGLPFDKDGIKANGCATTATHNVLQLMGENVPYEQTYSWHRENEDANFPGTIPWRAEQYVKKMIPNVVIRAAATAYPVTTPETEDTLPLEESAQRVIQDDGYGMLCFAYRQNGVIGAHYVAVEAEPKSGGITIYDYDKNGGDEKKKTFTTIHKYMDSEKGTLISAWGLSEA
ncbi:MAG: hypothetical protein RR873_06055, partial [Christensenella sp.]